MTTVFVYGTLKTGQRNWQHFLAPQQGRKATMRGLELHDTGFYPMAIEADPDKVVVGELFEVNDEQLADLDRLEGVGSGHYRRETMLATADGYTQPTTCDVYLSDYAPDYPLVEGGNWLPPQEKIINRGEAKSKRPVDWSERLEKQVKQEKKKGKKRG